MKRERVKRDWSAPLPALDARQEELCRRLMLSASATTTGRVMLFRFGRRKPVGELFPSGVVAVFLPKGRKSYRPPGESAEALVGLFEAIGVERRKTVGEAILGAKYDRKDRSPVECGRAEELDSSMERAMRADY